MTELLLYVYIGREAIDTAHTFMTDDSPYGISGTGIFIPIHALKHGNIQAPV
jgi:hypothetical protein